MLVFLLSGLLSLLTLTTNTRQGFEPLAVKFKVEIGDLVRGMVCLQVESEDYYQRSCRVADGRELLYWVDYVLPAGDYEAVLYAVEDGKISYRSRSITLHVVARGE